MSLRTCLSLIAFAAPLWAHADTRRVAVVVGANSGGPTDAPLRYAEDDASKVSDVLTQLGGVDPAQLTLLRAPHRAELRAALDRAAAAVATFRARPDDRTVLLFYYSGHSDGDALELGGERVTYAELRDWLAQSRADVRVAIVDGCRSGSMVAHKGGTRGPAFEIALRDDLDASGEVLLTSSAADEIALESREIRGSFFTHHLVSGLRGAADASGDGRVTLGEAYGFAFARTVKATAETGMRQHPTYDYRLTGKGELVLTEVTRPTAVLELPSGFDRALVVHVKRDQVLAEVEGGTPGKVALAPGEYAVRVWASGAVHAARVSLATGDRRALAWRELTKVTPEEVAVKGRHRELEGLTPEQQLVYEAQVLRVGGRSVETGGDGKVIDNSRQVYVGRYEVPIDEWEFYRRVGRGDLASSLGRRRVVAGGLLVAGIATFVGGGIYAGAKFQSCSGDRAPGDDLCSPPVGALVVTGVTSVGLLVAALAVGSSASLPAHEMRRLAEQHNEALRRKLLAPAPAPAAWSPQVAPYATTDGGGVLLGFHF